MNLLDQFDEYTFHHVISLSAPQELHSCTGVCQGCTLSALFLKVR